MVVAAMIRGAPNPQAFTAQVARSIRLTRTAVKGKGATLPNFHGASLFRDPNATVIAFGSSDGYHDPTLPLEVSHAGPPRFRHALPGLPRA